MTDFFIIPKNMLLFIAGIVWCLAGGMVLAVGLPLLVSLGVTEWVLYPLAVAVFFVFYLFVFSKLVVKHTERIRKRPEARLPVWSFFDRSSYIVMGIMMAGGMGLRMGHLIPNAMIAFFYSGLGSALLACGVRFLSVFARKRVLLVNE